MRAGLEALVDRLHLARRGDRDLACVEGGREEGDRRVAELRAGASAPLMNRDETLRRVPLRVGTGRSARVGVEPRSEMVR